MGGNSCTSMLATVSPDTSSLEETLATLRYACQAKRIVNKVSLNEDPQHKTIRELRKEVSIYLKFLLNKIFSNVDFFLFFSRLKDLNR